MLKCKFCGSGNVSQKRVTNTHKEGDQEFTCSYEATICNECSEISNRDQIQLFLQKVATDLYRSNRPHQALKIGLRACGKRPNELAKFSHVPPLLLTLQTKIPLKLPFLSKVWRLLFTIFKTQEQKISPDWHFTYRANTQLAKRPS